MSNRPQKITFAEMREMGVRVLVYCADYRCGVIATSLKFIGSMLSYKLCETFLDDPYFVLELPDRRTQVEHAAVS